MRMEGRLAAEHDALESVEQRDRLSKCTCIHIGSSAGGFGPSAPTSERCSGDQAEHVRAAAEGDAAADAPPASVPFATSVACMA